MGDVIEFGWSTASDDQIRAATSIAGHESAATRKRRGPIAIEPVDYVRDFPSKRLSKVTHLDDVRAARRRDNADDGGTQRSDLLVSRGARDKREHLKKGVSSNSVFASDADGSHALQICTHLHISALKSR